MHLNRIKVQEQRQCYHAARFFFFALSLAIAISLVFTAIFPQMNFPPASLPSDWSQSKENELQSTITIGILSTASYHHQIKDGAMSSWWTDDRRQMVTIFTDFQKNVTAPVIPNTYDTKCGSTYLFGLWCKDGAMIEYWKTQDRFKDVKWFVRAMDDSYLHLENLLHLVKQYDSRERILIGDMYCWKDFKYPSGGPGLIFSRGLLDDWDWDDWNAPLLELDTANEMEDDILWGAYLKKRKIDMINNYGITQSPLDYGSELMNYFLRFKQTPWVLPFRPVAIHQQNRVKGMDQLHRVLHSIPYERESPQGLMELPQCKCWPWHAKCSWNKKLVELGVCHWASQSLACFGPGPWPNLPPQYWHNEDMRA